MPVSVDKQITLPEGINIAYKSNPESRSLRIIIITGSNHKFEEFRSQLGDGYGVDVQQRVPHEGENLEDETLLNLTCMNIMETQPFSPHFILREDTSLFSRENQENLTSLPLAVLATHKLESVEHTSRLYVYKPTWVIARPSAPTVDEEKKLTGFTLRQYEKRSYGYISPHGEDAVCKKGWGWDALFVNAATGLTNEEFYTRYGKKTARQHTISDFIESYLRYKTLVSMQHHKFKLQRPIDFGEHFISVRRFVTEEKHLSNPFVHEWLIDQLLKAMINEGIFFKAAWSRPVKNYFSPPFSGLPLTAKKDDAEETIFVTHDMLHHLVCDLICDMKPSKASFYIYNAWRMISEACTLVLADMLYADGLIKSGVERSCVDKRIYPLFEAIKSAQNLPEPHLMPSADKIQFIKKLLFANVRYALLGDDSAWKALLTPPGSVASEDHLRRLETYKNHFGKFFIGDNAWTRANFDNMHKHNSQPFNEWVNNIGQETFRKSNIPLLSDVSQSLRERSVPLDDYQTVVNNVFDLVFETKMRPHLENELLVFEEDSILQSKAFRRFLIGQVSLFSRYPVPFNLDHIKLNILRRLQDDRPFSSEEQNEIRMAFQQYILGIEGLRLMSRDEAINAIDCSSVFPPVYISYREMEERFHIIKICVEECTEKYIEEAPITTGIHRHGLFTSQPTAVEHAPAATYQPYGSLPLG